MIVRVELSMMSNCIVCYTPWCYLVKMYVVVWCLALWLVFSVMWSELLMTSAINCSLWSLVYKCHKVECALDVLFFYLVKHSSINTCCI